MAAFLTFQLTGPMAAWGDIAPGTYRGSWSRPSKSAVLGLIGAALGIDRFNTEQLAALHHGLGFSVLVRDPGTPMQDYHTAQAPVATLLRNFRKSHGRDPATWGEALDAGGTDDLNTTLSSRTYYVSPDYQIAIWHRQASDAPKLSEIATALERPHYPLYLGRKSCPPSRPLSPKTCEADSLALAHSCIAGDTVEVSMELWFDADAVGMNRALERTTRRDTWRSSEPRLFDPRAEHMVRVIEAGNAT